MVASIYISMDQKYVCDVYGLSIWIIIKRERRMTHQADIDLDFPDRTQVLNLIKHIPARKISRGKPEKHNSGVYIQPIPVDPETGLSALYYKEADDRGYFKIDFLNVYVYNEIKNQEHYDKLLAMEPPWHRLDEKEFTKRVIHISRYHDTIRAMKPTNILQMAMFISAMRPSKCHLFNKPWDEVQETIWEKPKDGKYAFKKSHAIAYSVLVGLHMNVLNEQDWSINLAD